MTFEELLDSQTVEGELYERLPDNVLRCYACGHRCLIREGRRGICKVRFNEGGVLKVPHGYVGALQCDPTEKKPFFHVLPGSDTLTFGMLGCDFHCSYCFAPDTPVVTDRGVMAIGDVFALGNEIARTDDAEIAFPGSLRAVTVSGQLRPILKVFKHHYAGPLTVIRPYYLPSVRCTPDHRVYSTAAPGREKPEPVEAGRLTRDHYLAVPKRFLFSTPQVVDVPALLSSHQATFKTPHQFSHSEVERIMIASAEGTTSRELGREFGKDLSYIRHVRSKVRRGKWMDERATELVVEDAAVRFAKEHQPGLPIAIPLDEDFARLLGYYCAEGSIAKDRGRPNSYSLVFTFGPTEAGLVEEACDLVRKVLGLKATVVEHRTTLAVTVNKTSAALVFKGLCRSGARVKRVPEMLYDAPRPVVESFLSAYLQGDGHKYQNGKVSVTTASPELARGVAWLGLKTGKLPSLYENEVGGEKRIEGRKVRQSPRQYTVVWYEGATVARKHIETDDFYLVPLRAIETTDFDGDVFNLEVEEAHNYLAGFFAVSNCQNWVSSQALRDPASEQAGAYPRQVTAGEMVAYGKRMGTSLVGSSYNEPLITSEWAVEVFREAKRAGLKCVYISNGNATPEVLDYLAPYLTGYKIDLKSMRARNYRQLGGVLQNVLDSIKMVHQRGIWLEVVTLIIPGFNDSNEELMDAARYLASISPDIPWHVTAFHKDYRMLEPDNTDVRTLIRAAEIGQEAGLRYVYAGNLPGRVGEYENTHCPECRALLIERYGYIILNYRLTAQGTCPKCGAAIPGRWTDRPQAVRLGGSGIPRPVVSFTP